MTWLIRPEGFDAHGRCERCVRWTWQLSRDLPFVEWFLLRGMTYPGATVVHEALQRG